MKTDMSLTLDIYSYVVYQHECCGVAASTIAAATGFELQVIRGCIQAYSATMSLHTRAFETTDRSYITPKIAELAARYIYFPDETERANAAAALVSPNNKAIASALSPADTPGGKKSAAEKKSQTPEKKSPTPEKKPPAPEKKPEPEKQNEAVYFCRILEELHKQNELLEQLMDVVLPKYAGDLKDNINANFDSMQPSLQKCEDYLDRIQVNTRKRGQ